MRHSSSRACERVGVQMQHVEVFAGYDWLRIGAALHGPMVGVRLWF